MPMSPSESSLLGLLRSHGLRATAQRRAVLRVLGDAGGRHLSADDIVGRIGSDADRSTVYRILTALAAVGVIVELRDPDDVARWEIQGVGHHHAVCIDCGAITDVPLEALRGLAHRLQLETGFVLTERAASLEGMCAGCHALHCR